MTDSPQLPSYPDLRRIWLVRHGDRLSEGLHHQGKSTPLTQLGRHQAAATGKRFANHADISVFTSPMLRTAQTAKAIAKTAVKRVQVCELFSEFHQKKWVDAGRISADEFRQLTTTYDIPEMMQAVKQQDRESKSSVEYRTSPDLALKTPFTGEGETKDQLYKRCRESWATMLAYAQKRKMKEIVIVSHADSIKYLVTWLTEGRVKSDTWSCSTCSISEISIDRVNNQYFADPGKIDHLEKLHINIFKYPNVIHYGYVPQLEPAGINKLNQWKRAHNLPSVEFDVTGRPKNNQWKTQLLHTKSSKKKHHDKKHTGQSLVVPGADSSHRHKSRSRSRSRDKRGEGKDSKD